MKKEIFLSHTDINDKYHIGCNFLNILQLRQSIPSSWRLLLNTTYTTAERCDIDMTNEIMFHTKNKIYPLSKASCKMFNVKLENVNLEYHHLLKSGQKITQNLRMLLILFGLISSKYPSV